MDYALILEDNLKKELTDPNNNEFKVSINKKNYKGGCADEFVKNSCYAIDITDSNHRLKQCEQVKIGDILYMIKGKYYWQGCVMTGWTKLYISNGKLNPNGFWQCVEYKRKNRDGNNSLQKTDERICEVYWSSKTICPDNLRIRLNKGFNAVTIKMINNYKDD